MKKINLSIHIQAPVSVVWDCMFDEDAYQEWTKAFGEGSHFDGDWSQGSKILFLGVDPQTGEEMGLVSRIEENRHHEYVSIQHLGIVKNGVEDMESEEAKKWTPAYENYTFEEVDGGTQLSIEMDIEEDHKEEFESMWRKALENIKELAEKR